MLDECSEFFLDGITDVFLYTSQSSDIPVPLSAQQTTSIDNCAFQSPAAHLSLSDGEDVSAVYDSVTAKTTITLGGNGFAYAMEISLNVTSGNENINAISKNVFDKDCNVVFRCEDGTYWLGYALPATFFFQSTTSITQTEETRTVTITLKSMSSFIPITIKQ